MSSSDSIAKELFGKTKDGKEAYVFTLKAGNITIRVLNYGCVVKDILVPDNDGNIVDVCLGYDSLEDYETNSAFMGSICGRVSNRIDGGAFTLNGVKYDVSKNDPLGNSMCHGGFVGLTRRCYDWSIDGSKLIFTYVDVDGSEGFPGDLFLTVTYELTEESGLMMDYKATTNKPTPVDISNHFMVNLSGHAGGYIGDHVVTMNNIKCIEMNERFIPTGNITETKGTILDFEKPVVLNDVLDKMPGKDGLHSILVLPGQKGEKKTVARAVHPASGRYLEVSTTEPVFVAYGCFYLDFLMKDKKGKDGAVYEKNGGVLFMPQGYVNAMNQPSFPSCILNPGETYHTTSWYKFGNKS
ncbi:hypothetical protein ACF0H5_002765 [Mactra antiquata]